MGENKPVNDLSDTRGQLSFANIVVNSIKSAILGKAGQDPIDAMYDTFGYKRVISFDDYFKLYKRNTVAGRVIDAVTSFTWKDMPLIVDEAENANKMVRTESSLSSRRKNQYKNRLLELKHQRAKHIQAGNAEQALKLNEEIGAIESVGIEYTPFEEAVFELQKNFPLLKLFKKADTLNCIGRYSILVIGSNIQTSDDVDAKKINDLKEPLPQGCGVADISFILAYNEKQSQIQRYDTDPQSPRYGLPVMYNVQVNDEGGASKSFQVHHTRVIHIAEDTIDSEIYGTPKLEGIYNELQDLMKVVGGSAEMFWLGAYQGLVFDVRDGYQLTESDGEKMTEQIENYVNKMQRFIKTKGVDVKTLASPTADPRGNVETLLKLISGRSNIPLRILVGAENGVYAGTTDQDTFFVYITTRRNSHAEETIIRPLIDRLVENGYMPGAANGEYFLQWPELIVQTAAEKLDNGTKLVNALKAAAPFGQIFEIAAVEEIRVALGLDEQIPASNYDFDGTEYFDESMLDMLPAENDTEDTTHYTALELYRQKHGSD